MKAYLILDDGHIFCGEQIGADCDAVGELVFTTGMGGYIETLTDPNYFGQIVVQTFPLIGNYGVNGFDEEASVPRLCGYVIRDLCDAPSNFCSEGSLCDYLKKHGICAICGVDTREITRIIREKGVMSAKITTKCPSEKPAELCGFEIRDAVAAVSTKEEYTLGDGKNVAVLDLGVKKSTLKALCECNIKVTVLPHTTAPERILEFDGLVISDGPGDPAENTDVIENVKKILGKMPIFAIGLGHEVLALAMGGEVYKLKHGHRGANQSVRSEETKRLYVTNQNHGYAVDIKSLPDCARVTHISLADGSCEGISYDDYHAYSVQFSPDAYAGLDQKGQIFDKFIKMLGGEKACH